MKYREVLVLVEALYFNASINDKVNTMTVHQAYDIIAGCLGLVKLNKVRKTAIKEAFSPRELLVRWWLDYKKHCRVLPG